MRKNSGKIIRDKVLAVAATVTMVFSSVNMMGLAEEEQVADTGYDAKNVQLQLQKWLGDAKDYGIVAETASIMSDCESNIATNMLYASCHTMGASVSNGYVNAGGDLYVKDFEGELKVSKRGADEYVIYTGLTIDGQRTNQRVYFEGKDRNTTFLNTDDYQYVPVWNCVDSQGVDAFEVTANLESINNRFAQYKAAAKETKGVVTQANANVNTGNESKLDDYKYVIDTTGADEQLCFVNVNISDIAEPGALGIYREEKQMVIINVISDMEGDVNLTRFWDNGQTSVRDDASLTDQIIWNLADFEGNVNLSEVAGVVVAPKAKVTIMATSRGRVLAKEFALTNGEMHFVSNFVDIDIIEEDEEEETTTTTIVTTTPEEEITTSIPYEEITTTTEAETTTTEPETTTTEAETTTTEPETTTTEPETTTTEPETTTTEPETTTTEPETTTTEPETTTTEPETTTTEPETTTPEEEITTSIPYGEVTTTEPETTTEDPSIIEEESTSEQETTTQPETEPTTEPEQETTPEEEITTKIPFGGLEPTTTPEETPDPETEEEEVEFSIPFAGMSPETGDSSSLGFNLILFFGSAIVLAAHKMGVTNRKKS